MKDKTKHKGKLKRNAKRNGKGNKKEQTDLRSKCKTEGNMTRNQLGYDLNIMTIENKNCFSLQLENYHPGSGSYFRRASKWLIYL